MGQVWHQLEQPVITHFSILLPRVLVTDPPPLPPPSKDPFTSPSSGCARVYTQHVSAESPSLLESEGGLLQQPRKLMCLENSVKMHSRRGESYVWLLKTVQITSRVLSTQRRTTCTDDEYFLQ